MIIHIRYSSWSGVQYKVAIRMSLLEVTGTRLGFEYRELESSHAGAWSEKDRPMSWLGRFPLMTRKDVEAEIAVAAAAPSSGDA